MLGLVGEGDDFGFDARAVTGTDALDLSVEKGRIRQSAPKNFMNFFVGIAGPALELFQLTGLADEGKTVEVVFAILRFHLIEMYATGIDTDRSSGLHSAGCDSVAGDGFGQVVRGGFGTASSGQHFMTDMHQAVQESSCGKDDTFGAEGYSPTGDESRYFSVLDNQFFYGVLPDMEVRDIL